MEAITRMNIEDERLLRVQSACFEAVLNEPNLEKESLETILVQAGLGAVVEELKATNTLAFSFLRGDAEYNRAMQDLSATIDTLAAISALDAALKETTARLGVAFEAADVEEQLRLHHARAAADNALTDLALGEDGGGA